MLVVRAWKSVLLALLVGLAAVAQAGLSDKVLPLGAIAEAVANWCASDRIDQASMRSQAAATDPKSWLGRTASSGQTPT